MKKKGKELQDALSCLEKCCPGSTSDLGFDELSSSSQLCDALHKLDHARSREKQLREESDALLEGMEIIISSESTGRAFSMVLEVLRKLLGFDNAFVLLKQGDKHLTAVASSSSLFENLTWQQSAMFRHVLAGNHANLRDISTSTDWQAQPPEVRQDVSSALHTPFKTAADRAILVCTSSNEGFFNKDSIKILKRFAPLAGQALYNLEINELLREEINERQKAEAALKKAHDELELKVEQRTSELRANNLLLQREIDERKRAEEEIEVLLREVHHRVKNNYSIIIGLLNLQGSTMQDEKISALFNESAGRIRSMSLVHELLYNAENMSKIDFRAYINALTRTIIERYRISSDRIRIKVNIEDVQLNIETSVPLGLVINELISNSIKHAFPGDSPGEINISMKQVENSSKYELIIEDNGEGLPETLDISKTSTLGLKLVTMMIKDQLGGSIEVTQGKGTMFRIEFAPLKYKQRL